MLVGWAGGPAAAKLAGKRQDELIAAAVESIARLLGFSRSRVESELESCRVTDWQADPFARGAYSYVPVGGLDAMKQLAKPVQRTLFFAGEATHEGLSGTVAGAIASGQRAAAEMG
jgi:monoamine oxidase